MHHEDLTVYLYTQMISYISFSIGFFDPVWLLGLVTWMSLFNLSPGECTIQARPEINRSLGYLWNFKWHGLQDVFHR